MTRGYSLNSDGDVLITMRRDDWTLLMMLLGIATAAVANGELVPVFSVKNCLDLLNRLNEGNPNFSPYEVSR
jgi:hypothetical protein